MKHSKKVKKPPIGKVKVAFLKRNFLQMIQAQAEKGTIVKGGNVDNYNCVYSLFNLFVSIHNLV